MTSNVNTAPGFPLRQFVRIESADVTDATNILIVELNALLTALGASSVSVVSQKQVRTWLATNGAPAYIYAIDMNCPADIANAINIAWQHGNTMLLGDALYQFIQATLGFTDNQMLAAFASMQALQS